MTKKQIKDLVAHLEKNPKTAMIDGETAVKAMKAVTKVADKLNIPWALVGGVAMSYYGSPRLTKDVDIIASGTLGLKAERQLGFGGERYTAKVGRKNVPVDWIVRNDDVVDFYRQALADASDSEFGFPLITPEWLVILKYIAGRFRDQSDGIFLLRKKGLVDRRSIKRLVTKTAGRGAWATMATGLKRWYDLADGKITTEKEDYEADRL
jgi:hypothetical protein